jgi:prepilin-type N-terminal cleavage/methylation domain-containing protein
MTGAQRRGRRGFSLLEVMVALAILVLTLVVLAEAQSTAIAMTQEAERLVTATNLAQEKLAEVSLELEREGFTDQERCKSGEFDDFGDEGIDLEFGERLANYHFEWCVSEIDLGIAGDLAGMAQSLPGAGGAGESNSNSSIANSAGGAPDLSALGLSNEMITETLSRYIRQVRVRVWWGDDSEEAAELKNEVVVTGHAINPTGAVIATGQQAPGGGT